MTNRTFAIDGSLIVNRRGYGAMRLTGQLKSHGSFPDRKVATLVSKSRDDSRNRVVSTSQGNQAAWDLV